MIISVWTEPVGPTDQFTRKVQKVRFVSTFLDRVKLRLLVPLTITNGSPFFLLDEKIQRTSANGSVWLWTVHEASMRLGTDRTLNQCFRIQRDFLGNIRWRCDWYVTLFSPNYRDKICLTFYLVDLRRGWTRVGGQICPEKHSAPPPPASAFKVDSTTISHWHYPLRNMNIRFNGPK